jgi:hypothetical protein
MIQRSGGRQDNEATVDRPQRRRGQPGAAQRGSHRRQVVGRERPLVAIPQEPRHLLERGGARQVGGVVAAIVKAVVLDQGEGRFEHRRAEIERVVGDRFGLASDIAPSLQPRDVVGAIAPLAPAIDGLGAQQAAADIGVERGRRHAQPPRRFP